MPRRTPGIEEPDMAMTAEQALTSVLPGSESLSMRDESASSGNGSMVDEDEHMLNMKSDPNFMDFMPSGGKGGRKRKQSKPIRVFMDMENEAGEADAAGRVVAERETTLPSESAMDNGGEAHDVAEDRDEGMCMDIDDVMPCDMCNATFPSQAQLSEHIQSVHSLNNTAITASVFPTKYHQLGSELQLEVSRHDQEGFASLPGQDDNSLDSQGNATGDHSGSKSRIFHQDAYCELCDREFCNKYFLKTHKANKHGIYDSSPSPVGSTGSNSQPPTMNGYPVTPTMNGYPPVTPPADPPIQEPQAPSPAPPKTPTAPLATPPLVPVSAPPAVQAPAPIYVSASAPAIAPVPAPALPTAPLPSQSVVETLKVSTPSKPADNTPTKVPPDMEDYCEICQKHFCNKYYLKKHKHDVHGIVPDNPPAKRSRTIPPSLSSLPFSASPGSTSSNGSNSMVTTTAPMPLNIPQIPLSTHSSSSGSNVTTMANLMFLNPFAPPIAIVPAQPMLQAQAAAAGFMPGIPSVLPPPPLPSSEPNGPKSTGTSASSSPTGQIPNDALRGMGVLNADAYCELCRKEFCNKYFLKIHKANKHGIFTPDDPSIHPGQFLFPGLPPTAPDGTPLPQAMIAPDGSLLLPHPHLLELHKQQQQQQQQQLEKELKEIKQEKDELTCKACKKDFGNRYSLKIHMINVHDVKSQDLNIPEKDLKDIKVKQEPKEEDPINLQLSRPGVIVDAMRNSQSSSPTSSESGLNNMSGTIFGNMIAAKLADRVMCEICNKEVCNKYFLRTHKMKVHGIDPKDQDKSQGMDSPNMLNIPNIPKPLMMPTDLTKKVPDPAPPNVERPKDEELLKMGIDPEAYCEICKKEFCSKYFLKTHKLNIHGIKTTPEKPPQLQQSPIMGLKTNIPTTLPSLPSLSSLPPLPPLPSHPSLPPPPPPQHLPPNPPMTLPMNMMHPLAPPLSALSFMSPSMIPPDLPDMEHRSWKWKEPVNSTRVMCELCNKELCNKYFLKTHMLNKHGINWDQTGDPRGLDIGAQIGLEHVEMQSRIMENIKPEPTPPDGAEKDSSSAPGEGEDGKVIVNGDDNQPTDLVVKKSEDRQPLDDKQNSCEALNMTISAKTWHVPSDYSKGKGGKGGLPNSGIEKNGPSEGEPFIQKCTICGMLFGEMVTLQLHMLQDHKIQMPLPQVGQSGTQSGSSVSALDQPRMSLASTIGLTLKRKYQRRKMHAGRRWRRLGQNGGPIGDKVKSAIMNHIQNHQRRKKFRCAHCQERFLSRSLCQAHIRSDHPNAKLMDSADENSADRRLAKQNSPARQLDKSQRSKQPSQSGTQEKEGTNNRPSGDHQVPVVYATPEKTDSRFVMQAFNIQQTENTHSTFVRSMVYLPVFQKIQDPVTVSFNLTPAT